MRGRRVAAGALLPTVLVLAACSDASSSPTPSAPQSSTSSTPTGSPATPLAQGPDYDEDVPTAEPSPIWDAAARAAAVQHAGATMAAFARPQLPEQQWWDELAPLLTVSAQDTYSAVDPAEVPSRQVTGDAVLTDDSSAWLARLDVPTDVGTYALLLVREDGTSPWRTETITPPAALSEPVGR